MQFYLVGGLAIRNSYLTPLAKELVELGHQVKVMALPRNLPLNEYADYLAGRANEPGVWLGHSFGTQIVQEVAAKHPNKISHVILTGPAQVSSSPLNQALRLLHDAFYEPNDLILHAVWSFCVTGPKRVLAEAKYSKKLFNKDVVEMGVPTLVLHGEKDQFTSLEYSAQLAKALAAELKVIHAGAHGFVYTHAEQSAFKIATFIEQSV